MHVFPAVVAAILGAFGFVFWLPTVTNNLAPCRASIAGRRP